MRVCQFITNPYTFDTRVKKQCESLRELGCDVAVVGTARKGMAARSRINGVIVTRVGPGRPWRSGAELAGIVLRDRFGHTAAWPVILGAGRRTGRAAVGTKRIVVRAVARAKRIARRLVGRGAEVVDLEPALEAARRTESKWPLSAHLRWWGGLLLALLLLPLLPVLALLAVIVKFGWKAIRYVGSRVAPGAMKVVWHEIVHPLRQWAFRTARGIEMLKAGYRVDANVYQANDYDTLWIGWLAARLRGVPFVYDIHELYDESFPTRKPFRVRYWIRLWEGLLGRRALRTITVGDNIARIMKERYGYDETEVVRNAQVYDGPPDSDTHLRRAIGDEAAGRRRTLFVYAGRVTRGRGLMEAAEAMRFMDPETAALAIIGGADTGFRRQLLAVVDEHQLHDRVYVLDPVPSDDLPAVLSDADVGLMLTAPACLSYYYGLGNKMFHYVNAGIPVLASRQPEKERFLNEHQAGICVDRIEPEPIADAMKQLAENDERLAALKKRCRAAAPHVSWQREAKKYLDIYTDVYEHILFGAKGAA